MRVAFVVLLIAHGAIHLLGFAKAFGLAELAQLKAPIGRPLGGLWLAAALAVFATAGAVCCGVLVAPKQWWLFAAPAVVLSQLAIVTSWGDAKFGTLPNVVILVPLALSLLDLRSTSFRSIYEADVARSLRRPSPTASVTEADLAKLPPLVQTYLRRVGAVGQPRVRDVRTRWHAQMKRTPDAAWMDAEVDQHDFFDEPARFFVMDASLYGVPFVALHRYVGPAATMQVRVASLFDIVDARGPQMNQGETVTLFNDLCLLAPAALVDSNVTWEPIDERSVRGVFANAGNTIRAVLTFDRDGDLVDFVSDDRFLSADGKKYERFPWSTPVRDYRDFGGRRVATKGDAIWRQPSGDYVYGRFELLEIEYNVGRAPDGRSANREAASPAK